MDADGDAPIRRLERAARFGSGAWAALLALLAGFAVAALARVPPPVEPLTEAVMQTTPVTIANALLTMLGPLAPSLGLIGAVAICLPLAGLVALAAPDELALPAGSLAGARGRWLGRWAVVAGLAVALLAPLALLAAYPTEAASAWVTGAAFAPALWLARPWHARLLAPARAAKMSARGLSRRAALRRLAESGATLSGLALLGSFSAWANAIGAALGHPDRVRRLFPYAPPRPRAPGFPVAGVEPEVTPAASFYLVSKNAVDPDVDPGSWLLRITGRVHTPLTLSLAELMGMARVDQYVTLRCVDSLPGSHLMSNALWSGVPLVALLRRAGIAPNAGAIVSRAPDTYQETAPLDVALNPTALLAYGMNGETLARRHGGPARLLIPGYFGFKNVKWIEEIEVAPGGAEGYWAERGWTAARVLPVARIDVWRPIPGGALAAGMAYAGAVGVAAVEVQADGGAWTRAVIDPPLSAMAWAQWRAELPLASGPHTLAARVIDRLGAVQQPGDGMIFPNGAAGYDRVTITL
ncbi:MAG TPA: molybdopterin-dependent oxidoreductase [Ktedonobacterales bacterium]|nr:molybdopterin-dependent oxidoreductase [Ktedonobacterales bacterium]